MSAAHESASDMLMLQLGAEAQHFNTVRAHGTFCSIPDMQENSILSDRACYCGNGSSWLLEEEGWNATGDMVPPMARFTTRELWGAVCWIATDITCMRQLRGRQEGQEGHTTLATWPQRLRTSSSTVCARGAFRLISTAMTPNSRICSGAAHEGSLW